MNLNMTASLCSVRHTLFGKSAHPWVSDSVRNIVLFLKRNRVTTPTCQPINICLFCVNTRHPYYSIYCGFSAGLTSQTGSFIRLWPSWATDPLWGFPVSGCDLFGQNGYFPVVSFLDRQSEILLGNSDRSKPLSFLANSPTQFGVEAPSQGFGPWGRDGYFPNTAGLPPRIRAWDQSTVY